MTQFMCSNINLKSMRMPKSWTARSLWILQPQMSHKNYVLQVNETATVLMRFKMKYERIHYFVKLDIINRRQINLIDSDLSIVSLDRTLQYGQRRPQFYCPFYRHQKPKQRKATFIRRACLARASHATSSTVPTQLLFIPFHFFEAPYTSFSLLF